jgi:hypothetical protein
MTPLYLHQGLARTLILYLLICTAWGWLNVFRRAGVGRAYLGTLAIAEVVLVAQALLGGALVLAGYQPATWLHAVYGALAGLTLPAVHGYARAQPHRRAPLAYALAALFVFALVLRALTTGTG